MLQTIKRKVQKFMSIPMVRQTRRRTTKTSASIFSSSYLLSIPYHWFGFINFMREQRAVLAGKKQYYKNLDKPDSSSALLRRNTHRLEKGMTMQPLRPTFAENYIAETVEVYAEVQSRFQLDTNSVDEGELTWANNVLAQYFSQVKETPVISKARLRFDECTFEPGTSDLVPYQRDQLNIPKFEAMLALSKQRRSIRWYLDKKVDRELIDQALLVAREAPSACNRLPYEFRIFDDPALVKEVANLPFGTTGYADNIPVIAVLVGKLDSYFSARDRHAIYIDSALAGMSFSFALETLGLSSCMINWPDFEPLEMKMANKLGLKRHERPIMLMAIGYADPTALVANSKKKDLDTIRSYNRTS